MITINKGVMTVLFCALVTTIFAQPTFKRGNDPKPSGTRWIKVEELSDDFDATEVEHCKVAD